MNPEKISSSGGLTVIPDKKALSVWVLGRVGMYIRTLFDGWADRPGELSWNNTPIQKIVDIEDMMHHIEIKVGQLPDEWIIAESTRFLVEFWDWKSLKNWPTEKKFFNSDIIPLIWGNEHLPTTLLFPGNYNTIIEKFWILIKERLNKVKRQKLAELMDYISIQVDQLPNNDSTVKLASTINSVLWKRTNWNNQFKVEYINFVLMPFLKINEHLPEILENYADAILEWFQEVLKQKASSILQKKRDKLIQRISRSK